MWSFNYFWQWRRATWRAFWRQPGITGAIGLNLLILLAIWWLILSTQGGQDNNFSIIRYAVPLGPNWVGDALWLLSIPALATVCALVNIALAYILGRRTLILKQVWLWLGFFITLGWLWLGLLLFWINS
ncbi:MAG: hypothetical protein HY973_03480 [Candidatus Kerfeldbacteria bacterium]|nr:hypothetical protein [Candidatus Kerfeldbacteria bacterium]